MSYGFCSKFRALFSSAKKLKIGLDLTKLQTVKRWELFLRHSVEVGPGIKFNQEASRTEVDKRED